MNDVRDRDHGNHGSIIDFVELLAESGSNDMPNLRIIMDQMELTDNTSIESVNKPDKNSTLMESKCSDGVSVTVASLCPITPHLTKEKVKHTSLLKLNEDDDNPSTPMEDVFDRCGSGPGQMNHPGSSAARKLDFGHNECVSENEFENGLLLETVYESILQGIIFKQAEDILAEMLAPDSGHDVLMTPPSVARLTGVAETCPGAPLKPKRVGIQRDVKMGLCRKLDFDSCA
ncbi:hypothetical protein L1987_50361 [Smallanthus sonchifolius]|uniref:Uncharacterized protein n=1 Tax=Smallanthus sonchifolius TaxID=185202 RepID=A0ACB9EM13_9ASTR|nr:hypothetical protein L1987_50361 [Smallanthus sonchifolius]